MTMAFRKTAMLLLGIAGLALAACLTVSAVPAAAADSDAAAPDGAVPGGAPVVGQDYEGMLVHYLRLNPQAVNDKQVQVWWAYSNYQQEYNRVSSQDFKLAALLDRAKEDMTKAVAQNIPDAIDVTLATTFKQYDFQKQCFPVAMSGSVIGVANPIAMYHPIPGVPSRFVLQIDGLDVANCLPLDKDHAQTFFQKYADLGQSNSRPLWVRVRAKFDSAAADQMKNKLATDQPIPAKLESVTFLMPPGIGRSKPEVVATISDTQVAEILAERAKQRDEAAKAEADRQAQLRLEQAKASHDRDIATLKSAPLQVRLANALATGPLNMGLTLANLRAARFQTLMSGKPVQVAMLVQTDAGGTDNVSLKWPGLMTVSAPDGKEFAPSSWYLVSGTLVTPEGDGLTPSRLAAETILSCTQANCEDRGDATTIIDTKLSNALGESK